MCSMVAPLFSRRRITSCSERTGTVSAIRWLPLSVRKRSSRTALTPSARFDRPARENGHEDVVVPGDLDETDALFHEQLCPRRKRLVPRKSDDVGTRSELLDLLDDVVRKYGVRHVLDPGMNSQVFGAICGARAHTDQPAVDSLGGELRRERKLALPFAEDVRADRRRLAPQLRRLSRRTETRTTGTVCMKLPYSTAVFCAKTSSGVSRPAIDSVSRPTVFSYSPFSTYSAVKLDPMTASIM